MSSNEIGCWFMVELAQQRIGLDRLGLGHRQALLFVRFIVPTESAQESDKADRLDRVEHQRHIRSRERTVNVTAQNVSPSDSTPTIDEAVDMAVITSDVVGTNVHRPVRGRADTSTNVLRDEQERLLTVVQSTRTGQPGDAATNDDRLISLRQPLASLPASFLGSVNTSRTAQAILPRGHTGYSLPQDPSARPYVLRAQGVIATLRQVCLMVSSI